MEGTLKRWFGSYGFISTKKMGDFFFYSSNILEESRQHKIKEGDKVTFEVFKYPDPDSKNSAEQNGRAANVSFI